MARILAINGSYRIDGVTDRVVNHMADRLRDAGSEVKIIILRDYPIEFCLNCRECTQIPGQAPGACVHTDGMQKLVDAIEGSDGYILASPTNIGSVTALFKRFMERLTVYAYWPWGAPAPKFRKAGQAEKKAVLVSSCAAPGLLGHWVFDTRKQLGETAKIIGAKPAATVFSGLAAGESHPELSARLLARAERAALQLLKT